jgi:hypothetical protein
MTKREWTTGEIKVLRLYQSAGILVLSLILDRSVSSIKNKAQQLNLSLEPSGEDFDIRKGGDYILNRIQEAPNLDVCSLCGIRLASMKKTNLCRTCHLDQLIQIREEELLELERKKRLTAIRQQKARLRICSICGSAHYPKTNSKTDRCRTCGGD